MRDLLSTVDWNADPCQSFYAFACGGLQPSDRGNSTEDVMYARLDDALWDFIKAPASDPPHDPATTALRTWLEACRDDDARTAAGVAALEPLRASIDAVVDPPSFMAAVGTLGAHGVGSVLGLTDYPHPDGAWAPYVYGPFEPVASSEVNEADPAFAAAVDRIGSALRVLDPTEDTADRARAVLRFEAQLVAAAHEGDVGVEVRERAEHPAWAPYAAGLGHALPQRTRVHDGGYLDAVPRIAAAASPEVLRDYLRWRLLVGLGLDLPLAMQFDGPFEAGTATRCASEVGRWFAPQLSAAQGPLGLGEQERQRAHAMFERIRDARFAELDGTGLDPELAVAMRSILGGLQPRFGWIDHPWGELPTPSPSDHLANVLSMRAFEVRRSLAPDYHAGNGHGWDEDQLTAAAWNDPFDHTLNFGLGILQPPLFDGSRPAWIDMATIGWVMGHEMYHSLGPSHLGANLEHQGLNAAAAAPLVELTQCLDRTYAAHGVALPYPLDDDGLHLEETISDLAGRRLALGLYRESLPSPPPSAAGLSADALFFIGSARLFCMVPNPDDPRTSVAHHRIDAALATMPEFADAFACEPEDPMRIEHDCAPW